MVLFYDVIGGGRYGPECPRSAYIDKKFTLRVNNGKKRSLILHSLQPCVQLLLLLVEGARWTRVTSQLVYKKLIISGKTYAIDVGFV